MISATSVVPAGHWSAAADCVVLEFDDRHRRRMSMTGVGGLVFLLDLEAAVMLRGGDALRLDDGRLIEIVAAPEGLVEVRAALPAALMRLAWHIGNRHLPAQIMAKAIRLRRDPVIEAMLVGLGARLTPIEAPFDPEGGAYAAAPDGHGHDRAHAHHERGHQEHDSAGHDHVRAGSHDQDHAGRDPHKHPHPARKA